MKDKKALLRKVRTAIVVLVCVTIVSVIGIGYGKQTYAKKAFAAKETEAEYETDAKKSMVDAEDEVACFQLTQLYQPFGEQPSGDLLTAVTHKVIEKIPETETEEVYDVITTHAIAQNALETLEQETLELMASPAGSVWGGMIKVYAGDTPLLITEDDKEVLLRIVEAEATSEDVKGRMLVANVILNRVVSRKFPNSIAEVVFQNNGVTYQFAPIKDGRYWTVNVSDKTREAVERVLAGEDYSQGALYFAARRLANQKAMSWFDSSLKRLFQYGVHEFFTDK